MGKPGGFFKRLKRKQAKEASKQRRGTTGASKEERRRKRDEKTEYYAARREAHQLAAVSSSSDEEVSTDSDAETCKEKRKLQRLRALLGLEKQNGARKNAAKRARTRSRSNSGSDDGDSHEGNSSSQDDEERAEMHSCYSSSEDDNAGGEGEFNNKNNITNKKASNSSGAKAKNKQQQKQHKRQAAIDRLMEEDPEDWKAYLGDDEEGDGEDERDSDSDDEGFLVDGDDELDDDEDEEDVDEEGVNPVFDLDDDDFDDGAELFDQVEILGPAEEEAEEDEELDEDNEEEEGEEDEEEKEAEYFDEDDDESPNDLDTPQRHRRRGTSAKAATAALVDQETTILLPQFVLGTSSLSTLQRSEAVRDGDPWLHKYHLDKHGEVDKTGLQPIPLAPSAVEALKHSNDALIERAAEEEAKVEKWKRGVFFVSPNDYANVHPENITVAATAQARKHFLHEPFCLTTGKKPLSTSSSMKTGVATSAGTSGSSGILSGLAHSLSAAAAEVKPPFLHDVLWEKWCAFRAEFHKPIFTVEERSLLDLLQGYPDVMDCLRCWQNAESRREIYALHMLNHWFKARSVVVAHDQIIATHRERQKRKQSQKRQEQQKKTRKGKGRKSARTEEEEEDDIINDNEDDKEDGDILDSEDFELRDRGFGKTRLFLLLPMRNIAYQYVYTIVKILGADPENCPKLNTFEQDFTEIEEAVDPTFRRRPRDYQRQFDGNIDDSFCVGLRLEPSRVHIYAHPLNSDIVICSPLGLRRRIEKNGDVLVSLSSIEVCVLDEAHVMLEQNWQHVAAVMELLNKRPTDTTHGLSDLRRVYAWALEGKSGRHRQTVMCTNISNATVLGTFRSFLNNSGKVLLQHHEEEGVLSRVLVPVRQHFLRFDPDSLETVDDDRFEYFTKDVYASKINPLAERDVRVIIVVPSYFDFVRLRNYMYREYRDSYAAISEYTTIKQQRRALGQFSDLERPVLLVTERFYFFKRYFVKLAEVMVFYSPPLFPEFYCSLVNRVVSNSPNAFALTVFCRYDTHEVNRLVGTKRMRQLLERDSSVFSFVTS